MFGHASRIELRRVGLQISMQSSVSLKGFHAVKLIAVVEADQSLLDSGLIVPSRVEICQVL
jgi:hypothetical protein